MSENEKSDWKHPLPVEPRLYTRRAGAAYIHEKWGIPVSVARMARDAMTAHGRTPVMPPADACFGNRLLYRADTLDLYASRLIQNAPSERGEAA
jgi:hypothetical protein